AGDLRQQPQGNADGDEDDERSPRPRRGELESGRHIGRGLGLDATESDLLGTDVARLLGLGLRPGAGGLTSSSECFPRPTETVRGMLVIVFGHGSTIVVDAVTKVQF